MSRMYVGLLSLFAMSAPVCAEEPAADRDFMIKYAALTSVVTHRCARPSNAQDITVCGRRQADRYRVPFLGYEVGDPRGEAVSGEKVRLQHQTTPLQDHGPFLIGGGFTGVTAKFALGDGALKLRPLAD
jgi:hypothetical protein